MKNKNLKKEWRRWEVHQSEIKVYFHYTFEGGKRGKATHKTNEVYKGTSFPKPKWDHNPFPSPRSSLTESFIFFPLSTNRTGLYISPHLFTLVLRPFSDFHFRFITLKLYTSLKHLQDSLKWSKTSPNARNLSQFWSSPRSPRFPSSPLAQIDTLTFKTIHDNRLTRTNFYF